MLNEVAPSLELCLNTIASELASAQKQASPLTELVDSAKSLREEVQGLKGSVMMMPSATPVEENMLVSIAEGKIVEVVEKVYDENRERSLHLDRAEQSAGHAGGLLTALRSFLDLTVVR